MHIARHFGGEIIAADSRTIYRDMNIGTAKPTLDERTAIRHHLIDIVDMSESFTAADFKRRADTCIAEITKRGKLPIMVGGTGLYIDSVLFDFNFQKPGDLAQRDELGKLTVEELQERLRIAGISLPENSRNPRHLIRRLETGEVKPQTQTLRRNTLIIGMDIDRDILRSRIATRVQHMFAQGLEQEVQNLVEKYGWECKPLQTIGYQEFKPYFEGNQTIADTEARIIQNTISYAKRQRTWFARNKSIHWCSEQLQIEDLITTFLSK